MKILLFIILIEYLFLIYIMRRFNKKSTKKPEEKILELTSENENLSRINTELLNKNKELECDIEFLKIQKEKYVDLYITGKMIN